MCIFDVSLLQLPLTQEYINNITKGIFEVTVSATLEDQSLSTLALIRNLVKEIAVNCSADSMVML